jgi:hypothetical protein
MVWSLPFAQLINDQQLYTANDFGAAMKAAGIVILLPLMSVLIMSLFVAGGPSRTAAVALLLVSVVAGIAGLLSRRGTRTAR